MATMPIFSQLQRERNRAEPKATWAVSIAAAILAIVIGLSAVDVQRDRSDDSRQMQNLGQDSTRLDGRGKWAGYM